MRSGSLEIICGCMFSGKTEELIRRITRAKLAKQTVQVFKPVIDNRYSDDCVVTHLRHCFEATAVKNSDELLRMLHIDVDVIGIDEAQFFDVAIIDICDELADSGKRVIVAGLDSDSNSHPFGPMGALMCVADSITKLNAICVKCGDIATKSYRLVKSKEQIMIGGDGIYEARCRRCAKIA